MRTASWLKIRHCASPQNVASNVKRPERNDNLNHKLTNKVIQLWDRNEY
jgi:hypothetical protein